MDLSLCLPLQQRSTGDGRQYAIIEALGAIEAVRVFEDERTLTYAYLLVNTDPRGFGELARRYPSLTFYYYGDSYEAGFGSRALWTGGGLAVSDSFLLDGCDRMCSFVRHVPEAAPPIPPAYADTFNIDDDPEPVLPEWADVREEVRRACEAADGKESKP